MWLHGGAPTLANEDLRGTQGRRFSGKERRKLTLAIGLPARDAEPERVEFFVVKVS